MPRLPLRFSLKTLFVLILGIAIGYTLNLHFAPPAPPTAAPYMIEPPDILHVGVSGPAHPGRSMISGSHLVSPDGTVTLGTLGAIRVVGLTVEQAREAIGQAVGVDVSRITVMVTSYNSKICYVVLTGDGGGDTVMRIPVTGRTTALNALALMGRSAQAPSTKVWIARPEPGSNKPKILPVSWDPTTGRVSKKTDHQLLAGDRLFIGRRLAGR